ncbi:MAG: hypothetical protein V7K47_10380 [Nostoc sp.]
MFISLLASGRVLSTYFAETLINQGISDRRRIIKIKKSLDIDIFQLDDANILNPVANQCYCQASSKIFLQIS